MNNEEMGTVLLARHEFIGRFCAEKGWDRENLSFDQILELRAQGEWKNAGRDVARQSAELDAQGEDGE